MSTTKTLIAAALAALPVTAAAHGIEFHLGFGFWHDLAHAAPYLAGALAAAALVLVFVRWQDARGE